MLSISRRACRNCMKQIKVANHIMMQNDAKPNCCSKWEDKLQRNIPWQSCFHQLSKIYDVNIKWFQMRFIHRIIGTNVMLNEMGVTNNNKCSFCLIAKDTIQHIFWECKQPTVLDTLFGPTEREMYFLLQIKTVWCLILFGIEDNIKTENVVTIQIQKRKEKRASNIDTFRKRARRFLQLHLRFHV